MTPVDVQPIAVDPVEMFERVLEHAWQILKEAFDAYGSLPEIQTLFEGTDLTMPKQAAELVLVNMLLEISESISRFSPWYTKPARSFGIISIRDPKTNCIRRSLAPEAIQKWSTLITQLAVSIRKNSGLIHAVILVDGLMGNASSEDPCIIAHCGCMPPRTIQIKQSILDQAYIFCESCRQPFC